MKTEQKQLCEKEAAVRTKANGLDAINQTVGMIGYLGAVLILVVSVLKEASRSVHLRQYTMR